MNKNIYSIFLRLEGPFQAWGTSDSKFVIRKTAEAPTKSGIIGMICASMGISRIDAQNNGWLEKLSTLKMGVRIDRPGIRWWDYHTSGAKIGLMTAENKIKITQATGQKETFVTRREYLCDASFLVVLQSNSDFMLQIKGALMNPFWTLYLGKKNCPPSVPIYFHFSNEFYDIESALKSVCYQPRTKYEETPEKVESLLDWTPDNENSEIPADSEIWYDDPASFLWPYHNARVVIRKKYQLEKEIKIGEHQISSTPNLQTPKADYTNTEYKKIRKERLDRDFHLCVFCKQPADTVQHITYRHAGGKERIEELRSLCRLCHDAVTMIEYGENMGIDRINPEDPKWRNDIIKKRDDIIKFRSVSTRNRRLIGEVI